MDDDFRHRLFDPPAAHRLVLARRPNRAAVDAVVSDVVWTDVVRLLRWATADTGGLTEVDSGRWWRLAVACADVHRRLPGLVDEVGEAWQDEEPAVPDPDDDAATRAARVAGRLTTLLLSDGPVPLRAVASQVDALGAAALSAFAERVPWTMPVPHGRSGP